MRLIGAFFAVVLAALAFSPPTVSHAEKRIPLKSVKNRAASEYGLLDSLRFTLPYDTAAVAAVLAETLETVSATDWLWDAHSSTPMTSHPVARLWLTSTTAFAGDSLYYAITPYINGVGSSTATYTGVAVTASNKTVGIPIMVDADAGGANLWRAPAFRVMLRADKTAGVGTSVTITDASIVYEPAIVPDGYVDLRNDRNRAASIDGALDSLSFALTGTSVPETLRAIATTDWSFSRHTPTLATSTPVARLWITTAGAVTGDSLYYAVQVSSDGGTAYSQSGTFTGAAFGTSGDKVIGIPLFCKSDAGDNNLWRAPVFRIILRSDATSGVGAGVQITSARVQYPKGF